MQVAFCAMFELEEGGGNFPPEDFAKLAQARFANELSGFIITVAAIYAGKIVLCLMILVAFFTNP